ncbi:hypothetical protein IE53DRAFT_359317 [Violaceomyces palustris]|uniref:Uncharacterized protein n=1 Tax=Violaceomyces palustris TaxID=1673888 RepID=A0ACD0P8A4_9BASI|nr:hypothetical protein IE53DRAFT_359317 [Violaceomyces palustris]
METLVGEDEDGQRNLFNASVPRAVKQVILSQQRYATSCSSALPFVLPISLDAGTLSHRIEACLESIVRDSVDFVRGLDAGHRQGDPRLQIPANLQPQPMEQGGSLGKAQALEAELRRILPSGPTTPRVINLTAKEVFICGCSQGLCNRGCRGTPGRLEIQACLQPQPMERGEILAKAQSQVQAACKSSSSSLIPFTTRPPRGSTPSPYPAKTLEPDFVLTVLTAWVASPSPGLYHSKGNSYLGHTKCILGTNQPFASPLLNWAKKHSEDFLSTFNHASIWRDGTNVSRLDSNGVTNAANLRRSIQLIDECDLNLDVDLWFVLTDTSEAIVRLFPPWIPSFTENGQGRETAHPANH